MSEEITDEMAVSHFKEKVLGKLSLERQKNIFVVVGTEKYPLSDVAKHMEAKDEIGKREIEIEKEHMRYLGKGK